ncbi:MAG: hypothetical protein WKG01_13165 [Kofleriaceae bacterium]
MPVAYIDLQPGLSTNARERLAKEVTAALHDAYQIPDTRIFLREWPVGTVSIDGVLGAPFRPICNFVVPPGLPSDAKRSLVKRVSRSIGEACDLRQDVVPLPSGKAVSTHWVLAFFSEYPLDRAALDDLMAFENPMVTESMETAIQVQAGRSQ